MVIDKKKEYWTDVILKNPSKYEGLFVIHNETEILFAHEDMIEAEKFLKKNNANYSNDLGLFLVPHQFGLIRLRMLKIQSLMTGEWTPMHRVYFILKDGSESHIDMIVDSGADITFIPKKVGERFGLIHYPDEPFFKAKGVGGPVPYLLRQMKVNIDGIILLIKVIWGQDEQSEEVLLGRADVFDRFDVLFSQKKRKIVFLPNDDGDTEVM
jgi:hypothetical protein